MARTVRHSKLDSKTARADTTKLKRGRQPHWQELQPRVHLGYQRWKGNVTGRWLLRRYLGGGNKYRVIGLGIADDYDDCDGVAILSFDQAKAKALSMVDSGGDKKVVNLTVRQAMDRYVKFKQSEGASVTDVLSRGRAHILPELGDLVVSELTDDILRAWRNRMAANPAQNRPTSAGKVQYRPKPEANDDEAIRKRKASANRVLTMLKAILNKAFDDKQVNNRDAWGRRLKPFAEIDSHDQRYLTIAEVQRLFNGCEPGFRPLVHGALQSGCRYGELGRLVVADFNSDSETIAVRKSKSGKARHVRLTEEGAAFFKKLCAGRAGSEHMFTNNGKPWRKSAQDTPMRVASERAKILPRIGFHGLRHTWASHAVMSGVPLMVVANNLGHKDTRMVEKVYGHLAPDYKRDAIREGAPRYNLKLDKKNVVPLR
jgi:integrase